MPLRRAGTRLLAATVTAMAAGIVAGLLARLLMRAVTVLAGGEPGFSLAGTLAILLVFAGAMLPGAVATAFGRRRSGLVLLGLGAAVLMLESVAIGLQENPGQLFGSGGTTTVLVVLVMLAFPPVILGEALAVWRMTSALAARRTVPAPRDDARARR
ncbi:hypothetical protein [Georgenia sp. SYP-B2076]|uniref:hypothetical protein n=1 Tax=Georgenia sp. SYP-B2076 TaxID=2495881 RepID=UPI000F8F4B54|nr:hypothetical protein [Georgenia sp. SYP-B2076]